MGTIKNTDKTPVTYPLFVIGLDGKRRLNDVSPAKFFFGRPVDPEQVVLEERPERSPRCIRAARDAGMSVYPLVRYGGRGGLNGRDWYAPRLNPVSPREWFYDDIATVNDEQADSFLRRVM